MKNIIMKCAVIMSDSMFLKNELSLEKWTNQKTCSNLYELIFAMQSFVLG